MSNWHKLGCNVLRRVNLDQEGGCSCGGVPPASENTKCQAVGCANQAYPGQAFCMLVGCGSHQARVQAAEHKLDECRRVIDKLRNQHAQEKARAEEATADCVNAEQACDSVTKELKTLRDRLSRMPSGSVIDEFITDRNCAIKDAKTAREYLDVTVARVAKERDEARESLEMQKKRSTELYQEVKALRVSLDALTRLRDDAVSERDQARNSLIEVNGALLVARDKVNALTGRQDGTSKQLRAELETAVARYENERRMRQEADTACAEVSKEFGKFRAASDGVTVMLRQERNNRLAESLKISEALQRSDAALAAAKHENAGLSKVVEDGDAVWRSANQELDGRRRQAEDMCRATMMKLEVVQADLARVQRRLEDREAAIKGLEADRDDARHVAGMLAKEKTEQHNRIALLEGQCAELQSKAERDVKSIQALGRQVHDANHVITDLDRKIADLRDAVGHERLVSAGLLKTAGELEKERDEYKAGVAAAVAEADKHLTALRAELATLEQRRVHVEASWLASNQALEKKWKGAEAACARAFEERDEKRGAVLRLTKDAEVWRKVEKGLVKDIVDKDEAITRLSDRVNACNRELSERYKDRDKDRDKVSQLERHVAFLRNGCKPHCVQPGKDGGQACGEKNNGPGAPKCGCECHMFGATQVPNAERQRLERTIYDLNCAVQARDRELDAVKRGNQEMHARFDAQQAQLRQASEDIQNLMNKQLNDGGRIIDLQKRLADSQAKLVEALTALAAKPPAVPTTPEELKALADSAEKAAEAFLASRHIRITVRDLPTPAPTGVDPSEPNDHAYVVGNPPDGQCAQCGQPAAHHPPGQPAPQFSSDLSHRERYTIDGCKCAQPGVGKAKDCDQAERQRQMDEGYVHLNTRVLCPCACHARATAPQGCGGGGGQ